MSQPPFETTPPVSPQEPPTEEMIAERAMRANKATRGALAGVLGLEALVVLLVPRALAYSDTGLGATKTVLLIAFAFVLVVAAGMQRRSWGIGAGSLLQLLLVLTGLWLWGMFIVGVIFVAIWLGVLRIRRDLVGTPGGIRALFS